MRLKYSIRAGKKGTSTSKTAQMQSEESDPQAEGLNKKKKKKKKKKKGGASEPQGELERLVNASQRFPIRTGRTAGDTAGTRVFATRKVEAGELLLSEEPMVWAVSSSDVAAACHHCGRSKRNYPQDVAMTPCQTCQLAHYCSLKCRAADAVLHSKLCKLLSKLLVMSQELDVDLDMLRLAASFLILQHKEQQEQHSTPESAAEEKEKKEEKEGKGLLVSKLSHLSELVAHEDEDLDPKFLTSSKQLVELCLSSEGITMSRESQDSAAKLCLRLMRALNSNAHQLDHALGGAMQLPLGVGLFPFSSKFNHSCYPNSIFANTGRVLTLRAIREIKADEELSVNYCDLYQAIWTRRRELQLSKKFVCACRRCVVKPLTEEEKSRFEHDRSIQGIKCDNAKCPGKKSGTAEDYGLYCRPEEKKGNAGDQANLDENCEKKGAVWVCNACGGTKTTAELSKIVQAAQKSVEEAEQAYVSDQNPLKTKYAALSKARQACLDAGLHSAHALLFHLYHPLVSVLSGLGDLRAAFKEASAALTEAEKTFPPHFLGLGRYFLLVAEVTAALIKHSTSNSQRMSKLLLKKWTAERERVLAANLEANRICCGPEHPATLQAQAVAKCGQPSLILQ
eukprot:g5375.t1